MMGMTVVMIVPMWVGVVMIMVGIVVMMMRHIGSPAC